MVEKDNKIKKRNIIIISSVCSIVALAIIIIIATFVGINNFHNKKIKECEDWLMINYEVKFIEKGQWLSKNHIAIYEDGWGNDGYMHQYKMLMHYDPIVGIDKEIVLN